MESSLTGAPQLNTSDDEVIDKLRTRISELEDANANLRLRDEAMRRSNAIFEAVLANCWHGITLTSPDRLILKVVHGLTGYNASELQGVLIESMTVPEDREIVLEAYRKILRRECAKITIEFRVPRADGTIAWFSARVSDMLDDQNVQCIVWNYADITAEKQTAP